MNSAIGEIRSTHGSANRTGYTYSGMLDRMMGQLNAEVTKLQESLKVAVP
jgi:hypothetical protein